MFGKISNILYGFMASDSFSTRDSALAQAGEDALKQFKRIINIALPIVMGVLLAIGMFYGIKLGIKYAKAEDDEGKKKAKESLINVIVGFLIAIVFVAVVEVVLNTANFIENMFISLSV